MLEVERHDPRGEVPGEKLKAEIERGGKKGWKLQAVIPLQDEILLVWDKPKTEKRG